MSDQFEETNEELQKLANINKDACQFYGDAREKIEDFKMKTTFGNLENLHKGVVINLENYIRANGGKPDTDTTFVGSASEMWGKLMASMSSDVDETFVTHLEEAEDRCLHAIEDAMKDDDVTPATKSVLQDEHQTLQRSHDYMKALKETMKAA